MAKNEENGRAEVDLEAYLTKPATDLQERFAEWIKDSVGYNPAEAKNKDEAFREGVRIATATRMVFQASAENKKATKARRAERAAAAEAAEDEAPKAKGKKATAAEEPASAKSSSKKVKAAEKAQQANEAPVKVKVAGKKTKGKGRAAAATADDEDVAPF